MAIIRRRSSCMTMSKSGFLLTVAKIILRIEIVNLPLSKFGQCVKHRLWRERE